MNTVNDFIQKNKMKAIEVPIEKIILIERTHLSGILDDSFKPDEPIIVAKKINGDNYALIVNWADYKYAKVNGFNTIRVIETNMSRNQFRNSLRTYRIDISGSNHHG